MDRAADLVASVQALAQRRLDFAAHGHALPEVRACELGGINSFSRISERLSLRESCIRENRTCSLGGGRRPARKRASSDPTPTKCPNKSGNPLAEGMEGRRPTEENTEQTTTSQTQSWNDALRGLHGVREAG